MRVLVLAELGDIHKPYVDTAKVWLEQLAKDHHLILDYIESPAPINDAYLSKYQLVLQLNFPPYAWSDSSKVAFERYVQNGKGGWVGVHHASLLGEFDGYTIWPWFYEFMGSIRWKDYIAEFASGKVTVEDRKHPVMKNVPASFIINKDEWYTYDRSPRGNVKILATVDESSYQPTSDKTMGDHPVVWTNDKMKGKNVYIFMGHHPNLFKNKAYTTMLKNAILWAGKP